MGEVDEEKLQTVHSPIASEEITSKDIEQTFNAPKPSKSAINFDSFQLEERLTADRLAEIKQKIVDGSATPLDLELWKSNAGKAGAKAIAEDMADKVRSAKARNVY